MIKDVIVNNIEYRINKYLGKGKSGYSYLGEREDKYYVIKQIHHVPCDYYSFGNKVEAELNSYETLKKIDITIPILIDVDKGKEIIVKEYIDGPVLIDLIANNVIKEEYISQIFNMTKKLYPANLNIDYFPTNFVIQDERIYYIDYECNNYSEELNFENWGIYFWVSSEKIKSFVDTGNYEIIIKNGKPIRDGLEECVERWILLNK
jgi:TP53 regulating kinase and related kinases